MKLPIPGDANASGPQRRWWKDRGVVLPEWGPRFGLYLFLASLSMLFGSTLIGYIIIRFAGPFMPQLGYQEVPLSFWWSTVVLIASSVSIEIAYRRGRAGAVGEVLRWLIGGVLLAIVFVALQTPAMIWLLAEHDVIHHVDNVYLYGLTFVLVAVHAFHVIGGAIPLAVICRNALRGRYSTAEKCEPIRLCAIYWHFLDVVWVMMLVMFISLG